ncbi:MAG: penicillin acylase family protein [Candidatus Heimdallarchaeota archaeon]|nr:penicillin acylase family protein [Candidatus Heimdallarchaeota archaeon]
MNKVVKNILVYLILILLSLSFGIFLSFKSTNDYFVSELSFDELTNDVRVYRDKYGVPTIIADNQDDLFFAQGYEYARDRLWQAEFYRSIAHGELSRLFGPDLLDSDKFLRTLKLRESADLEYAQTSERTKRIVDSYIAGLNKYMELHASNLPLEFELLDLGRVVGGDFTSLKPKKWEPQDVFALQGVMAFDLSYDAAKRELLRQDLLLNLGAERAIDLIPVHSPEGEAYFLNSSVNPLTTKSGEYLRSFPLLESLALGVDVGSNSWVVSGDLTESGNPILSNDPHLGLATPSIWWQVHLYSTDGSFHVEGYSLPGTPGITIGHNEYVTWGLTNTGTDSIDLFYFNTRTESNGNEQYFHDNQWKDFDFKTHMIPVAGESDEEFTIKSTVYGPVLDKELFNVSDNKVYSLRWTLHEPSNNSRLFDAILGIDFATNADDIIQATKFWSVPGQNIVYATLDGDIGYQYTGFAPIRKVVGSGVLPQNGSDSAFGWDGYVPFSEHYGVKNPSEGYFVTANAEIDATDNFYITDLYATDHRTDRIKQFLKQNKDYTVDDMLLLQSDVLNLYAIEIIDPLLNHIDQSVVPSELSSVAESAYLKLAKWDHLMDKDSVGATIFATFRIYLEEFSLKDEIDTITELPYLYEKYAVYARYLMPKIAGNISSTWFDDVSTDDTIETGAEIASKAFAASIEFLRDKLGKDVSSWKWGRLHKVIFEHPIADNAPLINFNNGNTGNSGSSFTVKAAGGSPTWTDEGPEYTQTNGQSMRLIVEVENTWSNVWGIVSPGESGHYGDDHNDDSVSDWVNTANHKWDFSIGMQNEATFTFRKK